MARIIFRKKKGGVLLYGEEKHLPRDFYFSHPILKCWVVCINQISSRKQMSNLTEVVEKSLIKALSTKYGSGNSSTLRLTNSGKPLPP